MRGTRVLAREIANVAAEQMLGLPRSKRAHLEFKLPGELIEAAKAVLQRSDRPGTQ
jgi:hypothetical protein